MKNLGILFILIGTVCITIGFTKNYYEVKEKEKQDEIEKRALQLKDKDCYTWHEIEIVIFGEIQE